VRHFQLVRESDNELMSRDYRAPTNPDI
jgi:hypothetical protein